MHRGRSNSFGKSSTPGDRSGRAVTVREALRLAQETLAACGVSEPEADAQVLLAHILSMDRFNVLVHGDRPHSPAEQRKIRECMQERAQRKPLQYLLGEQEFWSLSFCVNPYVLIPRPETEVLVEAVLARYKGRRPVKGDWTVLDLGTGSGILAIVLAIELDARVCAVDVSRQALLTARQNAQRHHVSDSIVFLEGDLFAPVAGKNEYFDLIVSNPPYIPTDCLPGLQAEVRDYEPRPALDGGPDGLDVIRRIVDQAGAYLKDGGRLFLEIGDGQADQVAGALERRGGLGDISVIRDYCGVDRVIEAKKKG